MYENSQNNINYHDYFLHKGTICVNIDYFWKTLHSDHKSQQNTAPVLEVQTSFDKGWFFFLYYIQTTIQISRWNTLQTNF